MAFEKGHVRYKRKGNKLPLTEKEYKRIRKMILLFDWTHSTKSGFSRITINEVVVIK